MTVKKRKRKYNSVNYIDNEKFTKNVIKWIDSLSEEDLCCNKKYNIPEYIMIDLYNIGKHLLSSHKFFNYPEDVKEDMLQLGLLKCIKYATNFTKNKFFEKNKKPNAFTYFTTILFHQYSDYIKKYYRYKNINEEVKIEVNMAMNIYKTTDFINKNINKIIMG